MTFIRRNRRAHHPGKRATNYGRQHGIAWAVFWSAPTRHVAQVEARCHRELLVRF